MLRAQLRTGRVGVQQGLVHRRRLHGHHLGGAEGQGARLVKGHLGHPGQPLQGVPFPDQKPVAGGVADGRHDGGGGGQHQGAGAEDHQDGHGPDDFPGNEPRQGRRSEGDDHDPGGPPVRQPDDLGLARVGGLDQADHPLDGAVLAHPGGPHVKGAELVDGTAGDLVPHPFVHRQGLAGHHRLVDGGLAAGDNPVHRDGLSRAHLEQVAHLDLLRRDHLLPCRGEHPGGAWGEVDQLLNPRPGLGHCQVLQQAPQLHDEGHLPGGKVLPNAHRGDEGQGDQHIRLDVKGRDQADHRLQHDGDPAQDNGDPGRVKGQGEPVKKAGQQRRAPQHQAGHVLSRAPPVQEGFQFFHGYLLFSVPFAGKVIFP